MNKGFKILGLMTLITVVMSFVFKENKKIIVIDAGHGGKDSGVVINEANEEQKVREIAARIKNNNSEDKVKVILSREANIYMTAEERVKYINSYNPDLVVSLHINSSSDENLCGLEVFVSDLNKEFYDDSYKHGLGLNDNISYGLLKKRRDKNW
jgi:N-acetylmuramoyl-L-alanine amidase